MRSFIRQNYSKYARWLGLEQESMDVRRSTSCVLIQVDGLSYQNLRLAMAQDKLPFLANQVDSGKTIAGPWRSMLPTSTGAFQTGLFYGANDDVPGFFWYDKRAKHPVSLNSIEGAVALEAHVRGLVAPYRGLLDGGSAYSSLITGGARNTLLTFSKLFNPSLNLPERWMWQILFLISQVVLVARIAYYSVAELLVAVYDFAQAVFNERNTYLELRFLAARVASVVLCREISTLAAILDVYRGVGPVYLNYVSYDEHAHHRGPSSKFAYWSLKGIDSAIRRVFRAVENARALGIRSYDIYVWSDHGQVHTVPFQEIVHEEPEVHFNRLFHSYIAREEQLGQRRTVARARLLARVLRRRRRRYAPARVRFNAERGDHIADAFPWVLRWLYKRLLMPAHLADGNEAANATQAATPLAFVSTGPVAHLYLKHVQEPVTFEMWNTLYPGFLRALARLDGIGFALSRTESGAVYIGFGGVWQNLDDTNLLTQLPAWLFSIVRKRSGDLKRWANMESAGDIMLFGVRGANLPSISYTYEWGGHAGPTHEETTPFLMVPAECSSLWPELGQAPRRYLNLPDLHNRLDAMYGPARDREMAPHEIQCSNV